MNNDKKNIYRVKPILIDTHRQTDIGEVLLPNSNKNIIHNFEYNMSNIYERVPSTNKVVCMIIDSKIPSNGWSDGDLALREFDMVLFRVNLQMGTDEKHYDCHKVVATSSDYFTPTSLIPNGTINYCLDRYNRDMLDSLDFLATIENGTPKTDGKYIKLDENKKIEIYQTNSGLGYNQFAYLLKVAQSQYLCIGVNFNNGDSEYQTGELVDNLDKTLFLDDTKYQLKDSPLYGTFLFDQYISNLYPHETF